VASSGTMKLFNYFRSSASYRVRIALALKGLDYEYRSVHLQKNEQIAESYAAVSASRLVPSLVDGEAVLTQSLAIVEYLDETHPEPPLLPGDALGRARVRALACDIACEIHPLNNLRVLRYLVRDLKVSEDDKNRWYRHWTETGLETLERQLDDPRTGRFCHGDAPSLADITLVPQIFNARRFECRLDHVPRVMRVFDACMKLPAFEATQPSKCPDAE
jgi:maleylacetoacetate isomerase